MMQHAGDGPAALEDLVAVFDETTSEALPPAEVFGDSTIAAVLQLAESRTHGGRPVSLADLETALKEISGISIPYLRFVRYLSRRVER
jgi:hypothetical protein